MNVLIHKNTYKLAIGADVTDTLGADDSIPEIHSRMTLRDSLRKAYWSKFAGRPGSGAPIIRELSLLNAPGDLVHIPVTEPLSGPGVEDEETLEGSEEALTIGKVSCAPVFRRNGVRNTRRAGKKSVLDLMSEAKMRLSEWAAEASDVDRFNSFVATSLPAPLDAEPYTPNLYVQGGGTGVDDIAAADTLTVSDIRRIKLALSEQNAKPIQTRDGSEYFVLVAHPLALFPLRDSVEYQTLVREAGQRGERNPLFTGALGIIDGVILHEHWSVPRGVNATAVNVAQSIAFGAEFAVEAVDEESVLVVDQFDYHSENGASFGFAFHARRGLEKGSVQVMSAAEPVA